MDTGIEQNATEIVQLDKEPTEAQTAVTTTPEEPSTCQWNPPAKTARPKKKRRRNKPLVDPEKSREIPSACSSTSQKNVRRKRKRIPPERSSNTEQTATFQQDVWAWKAVGQLTAFVDWIREQQTDEVPNLRTPAHIVQQGALIFNPETEPIDQNSQYATADSTPIPASSLFARFLPVKNRTFFADVEEQGILERLFTVMTESLRVVISAQSLPTVEQLVKAFSLENEGQSDVASFASYGSLRSFNYRIAKWLVDTRKSVRLELNQGPWPADELVINSAISRRLKSQRFSKLMESLLESVQRSCTLDPDVQWNGTALVCIRVGLDVSSEERSLVVCATADSPNLAKLVSGKLWKRALQTTVPDVLFE